MVPKKIKFLLIKVFRHLDPILLGSGCAKIKMLEGISIGIGFVGGATFCHYSEEKVKVFTESIKN